MDLENVADRLDRLEQKIDKMADMMISLARTEEKLYSLEADRANLVDRINRHSEKLDSLNDEVKENSRVTANIVKLTWIIIGAIAVAFVKMFFMS
jgi:tetrahydromethanopterin S-methyltransferase subunit G